LFSFLEEEKKKLSSGPSIYIRVPHRTHFSAAHNIALNRRSSCRDELRERVLALPVGVFLRRVLRTQTGAAPAEEALDGSRAPRVPGPHSVREDQTTRPA